MRALVSRDPAPPLHFTFAPTARRMPAMASRLPRLLLLPLLAAITGRAVAQNGDITIYRCTDASGHLAVQDSPCAGDQAQQVRRMIQPADPPPRAEPVAPAALQAAPQPAPVVVQRHAPRPMYECERDDGSRYASDDGEGNPRWISSGWSYYDGPVLRRSGIGDSRGQASASTAAVAPSARAAGAGGSNQPRPSFRSAEPSPPPPPPPPSGHGGGHGHHHGGFGPGGGTWVRDACHVLPQADVCDRLRDRREQIRKRAFNAQANERATLHVEERGINARLAEDCGGA